MLMLISITLTLKTFERIVLVKISSVQLCRATHLLGVVAVLKYLLWPTLGLNHVNVTVVKVCGGCSLPHSLPLTHVALYRPRFVHTARKVSALWTNS